MEVLFFKNSFDWNNARPGLVQRPASNDDISFPYDSCILTFKALFGNVCVVEFISSNNVKALGVKHGNINHEKHSALILSPRRKYIIWLELSFLL